MFILRLPEHDKKPTKPATNLMNYGPSTQLPLLAFVLAENATFMHTLHGSDATLCIHGLFEQLYFWVRLIPRKPEEWQIYS